MEIKEIKTLDEVAASNIQYILVDGNNDRTGVQVIVEVVEKGFVIRRKLHPGQELDFEKRRLKPRLFSSFEEAKEFISKNYRR